MGYWIATTSVYRLGGDDNPVRDQEGDNDFRGSQDIVNKVVVGNFDHDVVQGGNQRANATESNQQDKIGVDILDSNNVKRNPPVNDKIVDDDKHQNNCQQVADQADGEGVQEARNDKVPPAEVDMTESTEQQQVGTAVQ